MHSHIRSGFIVAAAAISLMSSAALAQTAEPKAGAETSSVTAVTVSTTKWMTQETAGQWRASKLIGLNVYNDAGEKIGDISELIVDRDGKLEAVVVGVGGFLGLGEHDVAIPYSQIRWVERPVTASSTSTTQRRPEPEAGPLRANAARLRTDARKARAPIRTMGSST